MTDLREKLEHRAARSPRAGSELLRQRVAMTLAAKEGTGSEAQHVVVARSKTRRRIQASIAATVAAVAVLAAVGGVAWLLRSDGIPPEPEEAADPTPVTTVATSVPQSVTPTVAPTSTTVPPTATTVVRRAIEGVAEVHELFVELDSHLDALWTAVDDPSVEIDRGWAEECCGHELNEIPPLVEEIKGCVRALENGFAWVPCSIPIQISEHIAAVGDGVDRFAASSSRSEARSHLAGATSSLARADALMNELMTIHITWASLAGSSDGLSYQIFRALRDAENQLADILLVLFDPETVRDQSELASKFDAALGSVDQARAAISLDPPVGQSLEVLSAELANVAINVGTAADAENDEEAVRAVTAALSGLVSVTESSVEHVLRGSNHIRG